MILKPNKFLRQPSFLFVFDSAEPFLDQFRDGIRFCSRSLESRQNKPNMEIGGVYAPMTILSSQAGRCGGTRKRIRDDFVFTAWSVWWYS